MHRRYSYGRELSARVGPLYVGLYYQFPPQSWKRFDLELEVRVYDE